MATRNFDFDPTRSRRSAAGALARFAARAQRLIAAERAVAGTTTPKVTRTVTALRRFEATAKEYARVGTVHGPRLLDALAELRAAHDALPADGFPWFNSPPAVTKDNPAPAGPHRLL